MVRVPARQFRPAACIVEFIREERERCAELVTLVPNDPEFLLYLIRNSAYPDEIETYRQSFAREISLDPIEELM